MELNEHGRQLTTRLAVLGLPKTTNACLPVRPGAIRQNNLSGVGYTHRHVEAPLSRPVGLRGFRLAAVDAIY